MIGRYVLATAAVVLPYTTTHGQEAIDLYNTTGRTAQQWQQLLLYDILAENEDGLWVHTKFGYSVPRRNGKNEIAAMRELYGLQRGENILHTAHRTTTSHAAWERLCSLLDKAKIEYRSIRASGRESIRLKSGEGRIEFRTRSSKGGLGEGFDLLIIDDLGTEMNSTFVQSALYQLINGRLLTGKSTVISTNLDPEELGRRYGAPLLSRLEGEYQLLPFVGTDIRRLKREQG